MNKVAFIDSFIRQCDIAGIFSEIEQSKLRRAALIIIDGNDPELMLKTISVSKACHLMGYTRHRVFELWKKYRRPTMKDGQTKQASIKVYVSDVIYIQRKLEQEPTE